ncbi:MAG: RNA-binding cell elongation regulator Jag/EloR [Acidimicrobiia bacterium]
MEFVEVRGKSVEVAVQAAMQELQITDRERVDVEVVQQPEKAVFGLFGGKDAVVKVTVKLDDPRKRRRRRRKGGRDDEDGGAPGDGRQDRSEGRREGGGQGGRGSEGGQGRQQRSQGDGGGRQRQGGGGQGGRGQGSGQGQDQGAPRSDRGQGRGDGSRGDGRNQREERSRAQAAPEREERTVSIDEQVPVVDEFLTGLVGAFGLEGSVEVRADDDVIVADIKGQQTEAMVGPRGSVIEAIHELTKTVLHRQTQSSARLRLDIAGYGDRRRQALAIYAGQLIDQVLGDGGEVMLEPMSAADRKVIHDAVGEREGVRSYSEGESPQRYVVIARDETADDSEEE